MPHQAIGLLETRGLVALLNSEDELAGVLGHEMAHVLERHAARRAGAATPFALLFGIPAGILGAVSPALGNTIGLVKMVVSALRPSSTGRPMLRLDHVPRGGSPR